MTAGSSRVFRFLGALCAGASIAVVIVANGCLPDLPPIPDAAVTAAALTCGDGIVDPTIDEECDPGADASSPGCSAKCKVVCENGGVLADAQAHCYFVSGPETEYGTARDDCRRRAAHLVTIHSSTEAMLVDQLARDAGYWVGLSFQDGIAYFAANVQEPGYSREGNCPGCFVVDAGDLVDASACVRASGSGWFSTSCSGDVALQTICEREPAGQRSQFCGGLLCATLNAAKKRYVIVLDKATGDEAKSFCAQYTDGKLVQLESSEEREDLAREFAGLQQLELDSFWIGLASTGGDWTWDDGVTRPPMWADREPKPGATGHAYLQLGENHYDVQLAKAQSSPDEKHSFVCQRPPQ